MEAEPTPWERFLAQISEGVVPSRITLRDRWGRTREVFQGFRNGKLVVEVHVTQSD